MIGILKVLTFIKIFLKEIINNVIKDNGNSIIEKKTNFFHVPKFWFI